MLRLFTKLSLSRLRAAGCSALAGLLLCVPASVSFSADPYSGSYPASSADSVTVPSTYTLPQGAVYIDPAAPQAATERSRTVEAAPRPKPAPAKKAKAASAPKAKASAGKKNAAKAKAASVAMPEPKPAKAIAPAPAKAVQAIPPAAASAAVPQTTAASKVLASLRLAPAPVKGNVSECWLPLVQRLQQDPAVTPEVVAYFCSLPDYSPDPMGAKVKELFRGAFMRKTPTPGGTKPKGPPSRIYRSVVTTANVAKCNAFLAHYKHTFDAVEKKYPVPRHIIVSLLMVETRLGTYVGKENAFWSLACMAMANKPELVKDGISDLPITSAHDVWLQEKLTDKSNWAYKELRSLLKYCSVQQLDPHSMPGSVYGAIGICQFMPSNLVPYGDDGDGDGVVNLFSVPDAIFSAAKYLTKHGWAKDITVAKQRSVLKRYNNLNIYANTILALGESISTGVLQTGPPDAPKTAVKAKKTSGAKKKAKSKAKKTAPKAAVK